jgi:hypothetical protein
MIVPPSGTRVWLASGVTDIRRLSGAALLSQRKSSGLTRIMEQALSASL